MYKKCNIIYIPHYNLLCINQKFCSRMCDKVLGNDTSLWEDEVYNFAKNHQLRVSTNTAKYQFYYMSCIVFMYHLHCIRGVLLDLKHEWAGQLGLS